MPKGFLHVTYDLRCQIYALKATGLSKRQIAKQLGKHHSTIQREIKRNAGSRGYRHLQANEKALQRRSQASGVCKKLTPILQQKIIDKLAIGWSPEQISGRFKLEEEQISHESIYKFIWSDKRSGGDLYKLLRHNGKKYNKRSGSNSGRGLIPNRVDIEMRPKIVEEKNRIGDWEGDTVIGGSHSGALLTYVDRASKLAIIRKLNRKTAQEVATKTIATFSQIAHPVLTITYDNGKEFAQHQQIASGLNAECFFAKPYRSWERGLNEHTNGLIRECFPKKSDLSKLTDEEVQNVENLLNSRPRKSLNFSTPFEIFQNTSVKLTSGAFQN